jgi:hypothetical protein
MLHPQKLPFSSDAPSNSDQKFFGTNYGLTSKIPKSSFRITAGQPKVHEGDNGSGTLLHREFCATCGSGILEYGVSLWGIVSDKGFAWGER